MVDREEKRREGPAVFLTAGCLLPATDVRRRCSVIPAQAGICTTFTTMTCHPRASGDLWDHG